MEGSKELNKGRIGVVADDLTGALDTAGAFASRGLRVRVLTGPTDKIDDGYDGDAVCANTQTRNVDAALAIAPAHRAAKELSDSGWSRLYKKVDSTARGNLAAECRAVMDAQEADAAIVCPAFPGLGRTVVNGVLMLDGAPMTRVIAGSGDQPDKSSDSLIEFMTLKKKLTGGLVALSVVRQGIGAIQAKVAELMDQDINAIIMDAETDSDLQTIAEYSMENLDYLLVGSAGLAYAVGDLSGGGKGQVIADARSSSPVVIIAGSRHEATRRQVEAISSAGAVDVISMNPEPVLDSREERVVYSRQIMSELQRFISDGRNVLLKWEDSDSTEDAGESSEEDSTVLANFAGLLIYGIARKVALSGLIIAGGDTAFGVLRALGASMVDVEGEIERGVPLGVILDGVGAGLTVVTKAGGFGDEGLFVRALEVIRRPDGSKD